MKEFRVAFYKAKLWDGHKIDNIIDIWTMLVNIPYVVWNEKFNLKNVWKFLKMNYSHVEIQTPGKHAHSQPRPIDWWNGDMWTSTMRDKGEDGTVVRPARKVLKDKSRWDYATFSVHKENYDLAIIWAKHQVAVNLGYSKKGIGKFFPVIRYFIDDPERNICSEFTHNFIIVANVLLGPFRVISPRKLAYIIWKKLGKEIKPMKGV